MAKKKINDDTLLQLIRDGNSPAEAARRLGVGRAAVCKRLKALKMRHWLCPSQVLVIIEMLKKSCAVSIWRQVVGNG
jgi:hypothetical protein